MALGARDLRGVLDVARALSEVADPDEFDSAVLAQVAGLVTADVLSLNDVDPAAGRVRYVMLPEDFPLPPQGEETFLRTMQSHPLAAYAARTGDGSAHKVSDFLSVAQWHATPIYREFYRPIGVEHQIAIALPAPRPLLVAIAISRAPGPDFDERDRAVLDLVRPFLAQSWRNARERVMLRSLLGSVSGASTGDGTGVLLVTDPLQELTPGALTVLYRYFGRPALLSPLPPRVHNWILTQRLNLSDSEDPKLSRPLTATVERRRITLRYLPATRWHDEVILLRETHEHEATAQLTAAGLSPRETEVVQLVATGATNAQIAALLHVAPSTVKRHLDHVYAKLGVRNRVQAAAAARDLVAHHSSPALDTPFGG